MIGHLLVWAMFVWACIAAFVTMHPASVLLAMFWGGIIIWDALDERRPV